MIYSEKHNFLFLKGVKVAGTSVEIALSKICGNKDVITPIANIDERTRLQLQIRHAQNYGPKKSEIKDFMQWLLQVPTEQITTRKAPIGIVNNHMILRRICRELGSTHPKIRESNIFAIVRSPYQQILSIINHKINFKAYRTSGKTMQASQINLSEALGKYIATLQQHNLKDWRSRNYQIYDSSFDESIRIKFLHFENLENELSQFLKNIGVKEEIEIPFTKKGLQSSNDSFQEIASNDQIKIINDYFSHDFHRFGYEMILPS